MVFVVWYSVLLSVNRNYHTTHIDGLHPIRPHNYKYVRMAGSCHHDISDLCKLNMNQQFKI